MGGPLERRNDHLKPAIFTSHARERMKDRRSTGCKSSLEEMLKEKREAIKALADRHGTRNVGVFGSVATGEAGVESDIDLLVKMDDDRSMLDVSALTLDLQDLMGVKLDVISEDAIYWLLRRKILKEARPL
jgi:hypothetical protein